MNKLNMAKYEMMQAANAVGAEYRSRRLQDALNIVIEYLEDKEKEEDK